jgi:hypothetical protein
VSGTDGTFTTLRHWSARSRFSPRDQHLPYAIESTGVVMSARNQINYLRPAHYLFCERNGAWHAFGPMPLFKAVILAVGKYRVNHEPVVYSDDVSLIGIDAILAVRQRADFPIISEAAVAMSEGVGVAADSVVSRKDRRMPRKSESKSHHPYPQGGRAKGDAPIEPTPKPVRNDKSWLPGRKGQGGEGLSEGYGGSGGDGTGASGPEDKD